MENIQIGTVYDMVKKEKMAQKPYSDEEIEKNLYNIGTWFSSDIKTKYYMLLNNERHDYTTFAFINSQNFNKAVNELKEVLKTRGSIHSIDFNHQEEYFEIWIQYWDEMYCYLLFPCNEFIIEI